MWHHEGTKAIQSIVLNPTQQYEAHWSPKAFSETTELKFLKLSDVQLHSDLNCLPSSLKVLHWNGCSLKTLPLTNQLYEFVDIKLSHSKIEQLWHSKKFLEKLKYLDLSFSKNLKRSPDFSGVPNLEKLILEGCTRLTEVHPSLLHQKKLVIMDLKDCKSLKSLPEGLKEKECSEELCPIESANKSKKLSFAWGKEPVSSSLRTKPTVIRLRSPGSVLSLHSLSIMNLSYCNLSEESILHISCDLPCLKFLDLSGNNFVRVPFNISKLTKLEYLGLNYCQKLQWLPELPSSIKELDASQCDSLQTSKFNPYSLFASLGQYPSEVLDPFDMVITGGEIPSWFDHQEDGGYVLVPGNFSSNELVGIALCFLLTSYAQSCHYAIECSAADHVFFKKRLLPQMKPGCPHLYILFFVDPLSCVEISQDGTEAIQSIILSPSKPYVARWSSDVFSKTSQLKFLSLCRVQLPIGLNCLPSSLKALHWIGCPLKSLPFGNQPYQVAEIKLCFSRIEQLWPGKKFLGKLKYMDLSYSRNLKRLPDLSAVPNLETLDLRHCSLLTEVHPSLVHHKSLVLINLDSCRSLKTLPSKLEMSSLKELILSNCSRFEQLPEFGESMKHLSMLSLKETAIRKLPTSLGCLVGLSELNLENCKNLVFLPESMHGLQSLRILKASGCSNLCRLPEDLKEMKCLEELCATEVSALSFEGGKGTPTGLRLRLPLSVSKLPFLSSLDLSYCSLSEESFPDDFCQFPSLEDLNLSGNNFVRVPISIHKLSKLRYLYLNHCPKLQLLPKLPSEIFELEACNCDSLETFEFNPLKTCNVFESPGQDRSQVFSMLITGCEIPSWFDHQEEGSYVSVPHNFPLNERVGIALCFLFLTSEARYDPIECSLAGHKASTFPVRNGGAASSMNCCTSRQQKLRNVVENL
ncbi:Leucine-rich repeat [Sesbania bispinosa]|nr:Leucine-rich repeat [Sesbania bispinosa]